MKKTLLIVAAVAALAALSCSKEKQEVRNDEGEIVTLKAGFNAETTRTVRQENGKVFWSPYDEISVIRGTNTTCKKFTSTNTVPEPYAEFTGTMPSGSGSFWALSPYESDAYFDGTYLVTYLPPEQTAPAGSYDEQAFISAAYTDGNYLDFYHITAGFKISLQSSGVKKITLTAHDNWALTGVIGIVSNSGHPVMRALGTAYDWVELTPAEGTFEVGKPYHFVTIPNRLSSGFELFFEREDGAVAFLDVDKDISLQAAHFATMLEVDGHTVWEKDVFEIGGTEFSVDGIGGTVSVPLRSTVAYHVDSASEWIEYVRAEGDPRRPEGASLIFKVDQNPGEAREGVVVICNEETGNCYPVTISQGSGEGLVKITHHSLGMRFTATWCGWCPYMNESFTKAKTLLGDRFDYVNLHASSSDLAFSGTSALASQFHVSGYPTGIVDGRVVGYLLTER